MATRRSTSMLITRSTTFAATNSRPSATRSSLLLSNSGGLLSSPTHNHCGYFSMLLSQFRRYTSGSDGGKPDETLVKSLLKDQSVKRGKHETLALLNKYGKDLIRSSSFSELDPVIGRENEIRRCIYILSKRTKNNPVIIGEHGVGKTAVAHGVARRILCGEGRLSRKLMNSKLISLDMRLLVGGAKDDGNFEERFEAVLKEATESKHDIILFIEDIHKVVGAVGNLLKPVLERGELQCIGTTTWNEYKKMEKDVDLESRFQHVFCAQPSVQDTISILRELRGSYEQHHGVKISDSALVSAATLSDKHITDRFLPSKAIDLVDEAAAKLNIESMEKSYSRVFKDRAYFEDSARVNQQIREEVNEIDIEEIINEWIKIMPQPNLKQRWPGKVVVELAMKTLTPESMMSHFKEIGNIVITQMGRLKESLRQIIQGVLHYAKKAALYFAEDPLERTFVTISCTLLLAIGYFIIKVILALTSEMEATANRVHQTTKIQERHEARGSKGNEVSTDKEGC